MSCLSFCAMYIELVVLGQATLLTKSVGLSSALTLCFAPCVYLVESLQKVRISSILLYPTNVGLFCPAFRC